MTKKLSGLAACLVTATALLWPGLVAAQAPGEPSAEELVGRLLAAQGEEYVELREDVFRRAGSARSALHQTLEGGELGASGETLARLIQNALEDDSSWRLVQGVFDRLRETDPQGDLAGRSVLGVERRIREIGEPAIAGGSEILLARAARPDELVGLLHSLPAVAGGDDPALCMALRSYLRQGPTVRDEPTGSLTPDLLRNALIGLQTSGSACVEAMDDLAHLIRETEAQDVEYQAVEVMGWIGYRPEDLLTVMELGEQADEECLRRLLASSGNRIFDRMQARGLAPAGPESP